MGHKKVYIYRGFERFWHWMQAILIFFLAFTGFEIHGTYSFFGFEEAVIYHNIAAYSLLILIAFAIFWHFATGEWKQYVPSLKNLMAQANYYIFGIFKNAPHPTKKTVLSKLNPLQKLAYLGLKVLIIPIVVASGLLYMFYRYPSKFGVDAINISTLELVAIIHTAGAIMLLAFVIGHIYLTTTGETVLSNLNAMLTGYEELEEDDEKKHSTEDNNEDNNELSTNQPINN
jgi:thiosulfate reductase cytochrome b subunit